jgi:hypothetical protein
MAASWLVSRVICKRDYRIFNSLLSTVVHESIPSVNYSTVECSWLKICSTVSNTDFLSTTIMLCEVPAFHSVQQIKKNRKKYEKSSVFYVPVFNLDLFISEEPGGSWAWLAAILDIPAENKGAE